MKKEIKINKVIIDTNVWISFLIGKQLKGLHQIIASGAIKIITCRELKQLDNSTIRQFEDYSICQLGN